MNTCTYEIRLDNNIILIRVSDRAQNEYLLKTPLRIDQEHWDTRKQRPNNIYLKRLKKINQCLDRLKVAINTLLQESLTAICEKKLQRCIDRICRQHESTYQKDSFLYHMQTYIRSREHIICSTTHKRYHVFLRLLQRFEGYICKNLQIKDINAGFVKSFITFGTDEEYSEGTIHRSVHFFRTVLNYLEKRGIRTFAYELDLPRERNTRTHVTLSEEEIMQIKKAEIPTYLKAARDWLIISCYTGQRISDFMNFRTDMLRTVQDRICIAFRQQKTRKDILLPLHPSVLKILELNNHDFPKKMFAGRYNDQIKEVLRIIGFKTDTWINKRHGHRSIMQMTPKWSAISSHIGRRSFASNFYGKIPTSLLMEATGHSSERMFMRYINQMDTQRTIILGNYLDQMYRDRLSLNQDFIINPIFPAITESS